MATKFSPQFRCISSKRLVIFCVALLALAITPAPASAQAPNCLSDVDATIAKHLGGSTCTAQDVKVAEAVNPRNADGTPIKTCFAGTTFSFIADFEVATTATSRENIGFYMRTDGITPAGTNSKCNPTDPTTYQFCNAAEFSGTCVDNIVSPLHDPGAAGVSTCVTGGAAGTQCLGSSSYTEDTATLKSGAQDNCGDTHSASSPEFITISVNNILCPAVGSTFLLPNCTTWWQPTDTFPACFSTPGQGWPWVSAAIAGTTSKCNCSAVPIPITPVSITASAQKACTTSITNGTVNVTPGNAAPVLCDEGPETGSQPTYTVGITPSETAPSGTTLVVDQVCDNAFGTIYDDNLTVNNARVFVPCKAGTSALTATNVDCPPTDFSSGTGTCHFTTAALGTELSSVSDQVSASMHITNSTGAVLAKTTTPNSNQVKVFTTEGQTTTTTSKQYSATIGACATVEYNVAVANSSAVEESVSLTALADNVYGNISACTNANCTNTGGILVLGTNCLLATGVGTLAGTHATVGVTNVTTAGSVTIPGNSSYTCKFDGQFCSGNTDPNSGNPITLTNGCMTLADTITSTQVPDEDLSTATCEDSTGKSIPCTVLGTKGSVTVQECIMGSHL